jgi:hypothetical protein
MCDTTPEVKLGSVKTKEELDRELLEFVQKYKDIKQRDANWYQRIGTTVGASELSAIMGINPYSGFDDVVANKVAIIMGTHKWDGGEACWWGTLFEDVIGEYVEIDLGSTIYGDDICIQDFPGYRNSPDGYIVARIRMVNGKPILVTTLDIIDGLPAGEYQIIVLEFKCPFARRPTGQIPKQYLPQVLSGIAVSPPVKLGCFVDALFRKCTLPDLGNNRTYDRKYHSRDFKKIMNDPVAWGMIGVYATAGNRRVPFVDFGAMDSEPFVRTLSLIDKHKLVVMRGTPCFADGRGYSLRSPDEIATAIENFKTVLPGYTLVGVLPWKLFGAHYSLVDEKDNFLAELKPLIERVHLAVAEKIQSASNVIG